MKAAALRFFALFDVIGLPVCVLVFIWRLQFVARPAWILFPIWLILSFLLHRDTPKTLGWRADNLWASARQALIAFALMASALLVIGLVLGRPHHVPPNLRSLHRFWTYFAFCLLQQVVLNSFLTNRMLSLIPRPWLAAAVVGGIFAACHWPNPVLVPLTFLGGWVMAWLFARHRNIIPLAIGQAILGSLAWWSFPVAWHHFLRVGPGYYLNWRA